VRESHQGPGTRAPERRWHKSAPASAGRQQSRTPCEARRGKARQGIGRAQWALPLGRVWIKAQPSAAQSTAPEVGAGCRAWVP
jgi:hypothetical protein